MLTKITFTESQQNVNTSEIEHTCPTFTSLKKEYEAKMAKLLQDMETCGNHQDIGMSIEHYMIAFFECMLSMALPVMEFQDQGYKIRKVFAPTPLILFHF